MLGTRQRLCCNDGCDQTGVAVPQQLSIAGLDDLERSRHLQPSLTMIHMPPNEFWRRADSFLIELQADQRHLRHQRGDFVLSFGSRRRRLLASRWRRRRS
ncbi:substrate-binding domain-containing protein [Paracoccus benzoatiresistens]|uniref:substrate-binding domain-containing protein n=1 Tax=Paracoccus benzoatiresistens TaxID=2997341 RepID=UPI00353025D1